MSSKYLYGTVGVLDRGADFHQEEWESQVKKIVARKGPMTALMDSMGKESTQSRIFHWPEMDAYTGFGEVSDVYTEPTLTSAYASGGVDGQALYFKVDPNVARQIVRNQQFTVWSEANGEYRRLLCTNVEVHDATTASIAGILRQADTSNLLAGTDLHVMIGSTAMTEASKLPDPIGVEPTFFKNIAQKHAASWSASEEEMPEHVWNFSTDNDAAVSGKTFLQAFLPYFQERYEELCRYGEAEEKIALVSGKAVVRLNQLFASYMSYQVSEPATVFGIRCYRVITPHQPLLLIEHPLLTQFAPAQTTMFIYERHLLNERELIPLKFVPHKELDTPSSGFDYVAAIKEGYEQTSGLKYNNLKAMGIFRGVGLDNVND